MSGSNSATPQPTTDPSKVDGILNAFRVYFSATVKVSDLSSIDSVEQLGPEDLRFAADIFLKMLRSLVPKDSVRRGHLETLLSSIDSVYPLGGMRSLLKAALADQPDHELIWQIVQALIEEIPSQLSDASPQLLRSNTPIKCYTFSLWDDSETRRDCENNRIFREISGCTHRTVKGFYEKFFKEKSWIQKTQEIYESIKAQEYVNQEWVNLVDEQNVTSSDQVLSWLFNLQNTSSLLSNAERRYYRIIRPSEPIEGEAEQQIDLLVKRKSGDPSDTGHYWKDIEVIGELMKAGYQGVKDALIQLARYARDVFAKQPTRRFLHAFTICGRDMEAWVFDRSGVYSAGSFNFFQEPERFIHILLGYLMMDEDELGLDTFIRRDGDGDSYSIDVDWEKGGQQTLQLRMGKPLTYQRSIVSRATSCYLAKLQGSDDDWQYAVKFSWFPDKREPEEYFLRLARERGVKGLAGLTGSSRITSISKIRSGLGFSKPYTFEDTANALSTGNSLSTNDSKKRSLSEAGPPPKRHKSNAPLAHCSGPRNEVACSVDKPVQVGSTHSARLTSLGPGDPYDNREFRCLVTSPVGRPIYDFTSPLELLAALRDAIRAHQSLYTNGILHRDISENNIIITKKETGFSGMLIDLDLAKEVRSDPSGARCRTGTMEFMAIEVLEGETEHTYRHDLESFFYVLLWQCIRNGWDFVKGKNPAGNLSVLRDWYSDTYKAMARNKLACMISETFESDILGNEFPGEFDFLKPLCREFRKILFRDEGGGPFTGTPDNHDALYSQIIAAFDKTIGQM